MYYKIEKSGCCERKGMIQIRFSFYLDECDFGYEKHFVSVPVIPKDFDFSLKNKALKNAFAKLPTIKQLNPFHNHFCYFNFDVSDDEIKQAGEKILKDSYSFWSKGEYPNIKNEAILKPAVITEKLKSDCVNRLETIKESLKAYVN